MKWILKIFDLFSSIGSNDQPCFILINEINVPFNSSSFMLTEFFFALFSMRCRTSASATTKDTAYSTKDDDFRNAKYNDDSR